MSVILRSCPVGVIRPLRGIGLVSACAAMALAGCSADISRFDSPSFALGDNANGAAASTGGRRMAGGPVVEQPTDPALAPASTAAPAAPRARSSIEMAALPTVDTQSAAPAAAGSPVRAMAVTTGNSRPNRLPSRPACPRAAANSRAQSSGGLPPSGILRNTR